MRPRNIDWVYVGVIAVHVLVLAIVLVAVWYVTHLCAANVRWWCFL